MTGLRAALTASLTIGSLSISLGSVLAFLLAIWASVLVSRFVRFVLEEDVYGHLALERGIPYAISTMLHYAILLLGFFLALGALGIDLTKITILAGAFSVGVGFGLQNVINNFVSGLILLFERPINIGDIIEVGGNIGEVRASAFVQALFERRTVRRLSSQTDSSFRARLPTGPCRTEDGQLRCLSAWPRARTCITSPTCSRGLRPIIPMSPRNRRRKCTSSALRPLRPPFRFASGPSEMKRGRRCAVTFPSRSTKR